MALLLEVLISRSDFPRVGAAPEGSYLVVPRDGKITPGTNTSHFSSPHVVCFWHRAGTFCLPD
ncbi:MAG: hypothetical protein JOZ58_02850 [Acetobacteraceae bacterium]|nr:hypothetical protein [Acetobacteraceae bacterium]